MAAISDGQFLEKLAPAADKMADVTSENVHIASVQTKDSRPNTESLAEAMQCCLNISEKLDTLIDIFEDCYALVSSVRGRNYSTSRNGRRFFTPRDRDSQKSPSNTKNKKENSMCNIHKNTETEHVTHPVILQIRETFKLATFCDNVRRWDNKKSPFAYSERLYRLKSFGR